MGNNTGIELHVIIIIESFGGGEKKIYTHISCGHIKKAVVKKSRSVAFFHDSAQASEGRLLFFTQ